MGVRPAAEFCWISSADAKQLPFSPILSLRKTQKSHAVISRECCDNSMDGIWFFAKNCCTAREMWQGALPPCRNHCFFFWNAPNQATWNSVFVCCPIIPHWSDHMIVQTSASFSSFLDPADLPLHSPSSIPSWTFKSVVAFICSDFLKVRLTAMSLTKALMLISLVCKIHYDCPLFKLMHCN